MVTAYWAGEYVKVFLAYFVLMFLYPSILFRSYLKGKSRTFWFGFCVCAQTLLVTTVVLLLCLMHISSDWLLRILFYGSLIWSISRTTRLPITPRYLLYKLGNRTYGVRLLWLHFRQMISKGWKTCVQWLWKQSKRDWIELLALVVLLGYGILYFSWEPLHLHCYGFSDMSVHHYWTNGLREGQAFVAGIYPEGMHCFAYAISALFGIQLYNVLLFMQCANIVTFFLSAYLLAREITRWRGTALLMLTLLLTFKLDTNYAVTITSRLQASLPQEFCLYTVFLIPAFLIRYLKGAGRVTLRGRKTRMFWDENLLVFCLAIAVSISVHFYATLMAVFSCLPVVLIWPGKVFHPRRLLPLATAALLALLLAVAPMLLAFAEGIPLQGSLGWALSLMNPKETKNALEDTVVYIPAEIGEDGRVLSWEVVDTAQDASEQPPPETLWERAERVLQRVTDRLQSNANGLYTGGYQRMYTEKWADALVQMAFLVMGVFAGWRLLSWVFRFVFGWKWAKREWFDGYAMVCLMGLFSMLMLSAYQTDFPVLIESTRVCSTGHVFLLLLMTFPVDFAGGLLCRVLNKYFMQMVSVAAAAALGLAVFQTGNFHGDLLLLATRFNAAVDVTISILSEFPKNQYTIISPTDELYQVTGLGYHEELLTFIEDCEKQDYYIPTRYIFFYVEKTPIRFGSEHFHDSPSWLGNDRNDDLFYYSRRGEEYYVGENSQDKADQTLYLGTKLSNAYTSLYNREIVESRLTRYLEGLLQEYPNEMHVYYEDDNFICYCMEQNPARLFNFGSRKA